MEADPPSDGSTQYVALDCLACGLPHLVNVATLKLQTEEEED
jgi:hypothetical protein